LGSLTGIRCELNAQTLMGTSGRTLYGAGTGYLTPWEWLSESSGAALQLKTLLIPRLIVIARTDWNRVTYHRTVEDLTIYPLRTGERQDDLFAVSAVLQAPVTFGASLAGDLSLSGEYQWHDSNLSQYHINQWSLGLKLSVTRN
jgi:hypothetical protein